MLARARARAGVGVGAWMRRWPLALLLVLQLGASGMFPASVRAAEEPRAGTRRGTLALVNLGRSGAEIAAAAARRLRPLTGGWAREPALAALLAGERLAPAKAEATTTRDVTLLLERLRRTRAGTAVDLDRLGQLLGVDYLLLVRVRGDVVSAQIYSLHERRYAPQGFEAPASEPSGLADYVKQQLAGRPAAAGKRKKTRWWLWAAVATVGAVALGLTLAGGNNSSDELRIRVSR